MLAKVSRAKQALLWPPCRAKFCRNVATSGILCERCRAYFLALPSDGELRKRGITMAEWQREYWARQGRRGHPA